METISCPDLDKAIEFYLTNRGYRLDMVMPADSPRTALVSGNGETVKLISSSDTKFSKPHRPSKDDTQSAWITGRAGMTYRDLIPDRLGGKLIASHIRITEGGPLPDYVHYHKVRFQVIYCLRGRIRVVYEDQGPPFWLEPGDCVLQPPEIRHRVLEAEAKSEVLEVSSPAGHETWVEHEITLPTGNVHPGRNFSGQKFVRYSFGSNDWNRRSGRTEERDTGISLATEGRGDVRRLRVAAGQCEEDGDRIGQDAALIYFPLLGNMQIEFKNGQITSLDERSCAVITSGDYFKLRAISDCEYLRIEVLFS
jgi:quercetin dioxygenase-like cupin family protein